MGGEVAKCPKSPDHWAGKFLFFAPRIGRKTALVGSVFFITSVDILFFFSFQGEIDLFYALLVYLQIICIFYFLSINRPFALFLVSYVLMSLGVLTKGLPSLAFQGISIVSLLFVGGKARWLFSWQHFFALLVGISSIVCYFYAYHLDTEVWPYVHRLFTESSRRTVDGHWGRFTLHLVLFPLSLLKLLSPWILLFAISWKKEYLDKLWRNKWIQFSMVFVVANILLYWISPGTRDRYLYMFLPFLFNSMAYVIIDNASAKSRNLKITFALIIVIISAVVVFLLIPMGHNDSIPFLLPKGLAIILMLLTLLISMKKYHLDEILGLTIMLLITRLAFDLIVTEIRKKEDFSDDYEGKAKTLIELAEGEPVNYYAPYDTVNHIFFGKTIQIFEVRRLPFAISFHFTEGTGNILRHQTKMLRDQWYISEKRTVDLNEIDPKAEFAISKNREYVVFKY